MSFICLKTKEKKNIVASCSLIAMSPVLLLLFIYAVFAAPDPCSNCSLPGAFSTTDESLCQQAQSDNTYAPTFIRYPLGNRCYLQMTDCPAYDIVSGSQCAGILPPQQALECINGKFYTPGRAMGFPIDKIRCNPNAYITPLPTDPVYSVCPWPPALSEADTTSCGGAGLAGIDMTRTSNGTHVHITFTNCSNFNFVTGYDGIGTCSTENVVGICENGRFKVNGREIYAARCGPPLPLSECEKGDWKYNWMTDSHFKLGYNRSYEEAKVACLSEGGQLASIHSQDENDFIVSMAYMEREEASVGLGIYVWIGVEPNGEGGFRNIDNTPLDYSYWDPSNPSGASPCVGMYTGYNTVENGIPGQWNDLSCAYTSQAYACRKSKCTQCPQNITQKYVHDSTGNFIDGDLTFEYYIDEATGCLAVDFICTSSIPNKFVHILSGDGAVWYNKQCTTYRRVGIYRCAHDGKWLRNGKAYVPSLGICEIEVNSTCTP